MTPTPRATRLVRVADLQSFREAVLGLATEGPPLDARDRMVVVPTHAAAAHLVRGLEDEAMGLTGRVLLLPDLVTPRELTQRFGDRLSDPRPSLTGAEREVLLGVACRAARDQGAQPPFHLRPGLIADLEDPAAAGATDVDVPVAVLYVVSPDAPPLVGRLEGVDFFKRETVGHTLRS